MDGPLKQYIMGNVAVRKTCLVVLIVYNLPKTSNELEQIFYENNEGKIRMVL